MRQYVSSTTRIFLMMSSSVPASREIGAHRKPLNVRFAPKDGVIGRQLVDS